MTGYIKQLGVRLSSLRTRKAHGLHSRLYHVLVWQEQRLALPSQRSPVRHTRIWAALWRLTRTGPFELTKLSAQISVLMADRNDGCKQNDAIRKSYQNLGTLKTAQNLIRHRGWTGLYSGFHLHLREDIKHVQIQAKTDQMQFETRSAPVSTLSRMKA